jgi:hypothetical protein
MSVFSLKLLVLKAYFYRPKCTKTRRFAYRFWKIFRGRNPRNPAPGEGFCPSLDPTHARRFAPQLGAFGPSIVHQPPITGGPLRPVSLGPPLRLIRPCRGQIVSVMDLYPLHWTDPPFSTWPDGNVPSSLIHSFSLWMPAASTHASDSLVLNE